MVSSLLPSIPTHGAREGETHNLGYFDTREPGVAVEIDFRGRIAAQEERAAAERREGLRKASTVMRPWPTCALIPRP